MATNQFRISFFFLIRLVTPHNNTRNKLPRIANLNGGKIMGKTNSICFFFLRLLNDDNVEKNSMDNHHFHYDSNCFIIIIIINNEQMIQVGARRADKRKSRTIVINVTKV